MGTALKPLLVSYTTAHCILGSILLAWTAQGLCAALPGTDAAALLHELRRRLPDAQLHALAADSAQERSAAVLAALNGAPGPLSFALDPRGTEFQQRVWQALRNIPAGQTRSYAQLAQAIAQPGAVRAVGSACGANPIAVLIPCHRVVRSDGSLGGFHWGLDLKQQLLLRESRS